MSIFTKIVSTTALSLLIAGSVTGTASAYAQTSTISKTVQNLSTGSAAVEADTEEDALKVKYGDELLYIITVKNVDPASNTSTGNPLMFTTVSDTLPANVELVDSPALRVITADFGTIQPDKSVSRTYKVRVTGKIDKTIIDNRACFHASTGGMPEIGCDHAFAQINNPATAPETPVDPAPESPAPSDADEEATESVDELPNVGTGALAGIAGAFAAFGGYAGNLLRLKKSGRKS